MFKQELDADTYLQFLEEHHAEEIKEMIETNRSHLEPWIERFTKIHTMAEVKELINFCSNSFYMNKSFFPGLWHKGKFVGVSGLHVIDWRHKKASIGGWISKDAEGKGLAQKGFKAMMKYAFEELQLNRLDAFPAVKNVKSVKMCLALGFKEEGLIRNSEILYGQPMDHYLLGMLREEWFQTNPK